MGSMPAPSDWPSYRNTSGTAKPNWKFRKRMRRMGSSFSVMIERQRGEVGGLPAQDWSLRVTEVYRKDGSEWQLVHRHADPLVQHITLQQAAVIARGWPEEK
jgi:hypothetical protein